jgi:hypothetical protein
MFQVGDRVKNVSSCYIKETGPDKDQDVDFGVVTELTEFGCNVLFEDCPRSYLCLCGEVELVEEPKVKFEVGKTYKTNNGYNLVCKFIDGDVAYLKGGNESVTLYAWSLEGKSISLNSDWDILFEEPKYFFVGFKDDGFYTSDTFFEGATHKFTHNNGVTTVEEL